MAIILQSTDWVIPEPAVLNLPGLPTDPFGEVLAGDLALWDFASGDFPDTLAAGASVPGLVAEQAPATVGSTDFTGINAARGLVFDTDTHGWRRLYLPLDPFDWFALGSEPSLMLSVWLTHVSAGSPPAGIMSHAYQTSGQHQWSLLYEGGGNITGAINSATTGNRFGTSLVPNEPTLLSLVARRNGAGTFERKLYKGAALVAQNTNLPSAPYPINQRSNTADSYLPQIGNGQWSSSWVGVIHRLRLRKFDPAADIEAYLAAEVAANAGRFVGA